MGQMATEAVAESRTFLPPPANVILWPDKLVMPALGVVICKRLEFLIMFSEFMQQLKEKTMGIRGSGIFRV